MLKKRKVFNWVYSKIFTTTLPTEIENLQIAFYAEVLNTQIWRIQKFANFQETSLKTFSR